MLEVKESEDKKKYDRYHYTNESDTYSDIVKRMTTIQTKFNADYISLSLDMAGDRLLTITIQNKGGDEDE